MAGRWMTRDRDEEALPGSHGHEREELACTVRNERAQVREACCA